MSLDATLQQPPIPQVVQVWFEPKPPQMPDGSVGPPTVMRVLDGQVRLTPQTISWITSHPDPGLTEILAPGGRILIRVHCPNLFDKDRRPFSATLAGVLNLTGPHPPGGVFESWWFVGKG